MKQSDLSNPVALAKIIAASNSNNIPVNATGSSYASQTEGFPEITMMPEEQGGEAPHGKDFNGFLRILTSHMFNIQNGTPETFNPDVSNLIGGYPKNAQLWLINSTTSRLLKSTKDDNTDNFLTTPSVIGTSWIDAFPTKDYVDGQDTNLQSQITTNANNIATKANNNAVVHLAGTETISGAKTFTSNVKVSKTSPLVDLYNTNITKGTAPSSLQIGRNAMLDKDGKIIALTQYQYLTDGRTEAILRTYNPNSETGYAQIGVAYNANGTVFTYCPTPTDTTTTSGTQIATTGWVNSIGNNVVHKSANETIAGTKTFTDSPHVNLSQPKVILKSSTITKGTAPASDTEVGFVDFRDKDDKTLGRLRCFYDANKDSITQITAYKANSASDTSSSSMGIKYPASSGAYGFAPASDVNGSIVTTVNKSKSSNGYFQLGNGMIVQWGRVTGITSNTETTVTFPKAFSSSTSYTIVKNYQSNAQSEAADREVSFYSMTATSAKTFTARDDTSAFSWLAIGY